MLILDAHCDSSSQMLRMRDFSRDNEWAQVDFPKMREGGVDASFFALYVPAELSGNDAFDYACKLLKETQRQVLSCSDDVAFATSASEVMRNKSEGRISILLGIENSSALGGDLHNLEYFYNQGIRYVTLTHSKDNEAGDSCSGSGFWGGLSQFGCKIVREMNDMGMLVDLAHASDSTICDVLSITDAPVVDTHCCCRSICGHARNLSDELIRGIAETGGVVGISIYPLFLSDDFARTFSESGLDSQMWIEDEFIKDPANPQKRDAWNRLQSQLSSLDRPGVGVVSEHITHAAGIAGFRAVGIGTDYDGIVVTASGLEKISFISSIFDDLKQKGLNKESIEGVAGLNFLGLL